MPTTIILACKGYGVCSLPIHCDGKVSLEKGEEGFVLDRLLGLWHMLTSWLKNSIMSLRWDHKKDESGDDASSDIVDASDHKVFDDQAAVRETVASISLKTGGVEFPNSETAKLEARGEPSHEIVRAEEQPVEVEDVPSLCVRQGEDDASPGRKDSVQHALQVLENFVQAERTNSSCMQRDEHTRREEEDQCCLAVMRCVEDLRALAKEMKEEERRRSEAVKQALGSSNSLSFPDIYGGKIIKIKPWETWALLAAGIVKVQDKAFRDRLMRSCVQAAGLFTPCECKDWMRNLSFLQKELWNKASLRVHYPRFALEEASLENEIYLDHNDLEQLLDHLDDRQCDKETFYAWLHSLDGINLCSRMIGDFSKVAEAVRGEVSSNIMERVEAILVLSTLTVALSDESWPQTWL